MCHEHNNNKAKVENWGIQVQSDVLWCPDNIITGLGIKIKLIIMVNLLCDRSQIDKTMLITSFKCK